MRNAIDLPPGLQEVKVTVTDANGDVVWFDRVRPTNGQLVIEAIGTVSHKAAGDPQPANKYRNVKAEARPSKPGVMVCPDCLGTPEFQTDDVAEGLAPTVITCHNTTTPKMPSPAAAIAKWNAMVAARFVTE